jgi:hypothetical protein
VVEARVLPAPEPSREPAPLSKSEEKQKRKRLHTAFMLGFIPGVGAIYNGEYRKAGVHLAIFVAISMFLDVASGSIRDAFGWVRIAFFFYMAFEAYHTALKKK